jgi:hypothetical protein
MMAAARDTPAQRESMIEQIMFEHQKGPDGLNDQLIIRLSR